MHRYDFTEQYNFNKEMKKRGNYRCDGIEIDRVNLGDGFYAALMQSDFATVDQYRVTVWLGHIDCEEKVYAFTMMLGYNCFILDDEVIRIVKLKFKSNYAKLKEVYQKKFLQVKK